MKERIVNLLYDFIYLNLLILAGYSLLFGGLDSSIWEMFFLVLFGVIISVALICCILLDEENKK